MYLGLFSPSTPFSSGPPLFVFPRRFSGLHWVTTRRLVFLDYFREVLGVDKALVFFCVSHTSTSTLFVASYN